MSYQKVISIENCNFQNILNFIEECIVKINIKIKPKNEDIKVLIPRILRYEYEKYIHSLNFFNPTILIGDDGKIKPMKYIGIDLDFNSPENAVYVFHVDYILYKDLNFKLEIK